MERPSAVSVLVDVIRAMIAEDPRPHGAQGRVARALDIDGSVVSKLLRGERAGVSLATFQEAARRSERYRDALKVAGVRLDVGATAPATKPAELATDAAMADLDALRGQAVSEVFLDAELGVPKEHYATLQGLARDLAASDGLAGLKRALVRLYRGWLAEQRGKPQLPPRPPSDDDPTAAAKARGAAKGHMQLPKPRERGR